MYEILPYSYKQSAKLGYTIKPSKNPKHKIDVFKDKKFLFSIGDIRYMDFPNYIKTNGIEYALKRQKLYKIRHAKDNVVGTRGHASFNILW